MQGTVGRPNRHIGCVPCGSGNDYVRNFGTQAQFLDLDAQLAAQPFATDVIRTPQGCGIDIYAAGIDAQVANGIPKWRRVPLLRRHNGLHAVDSRGRVQHLQAPSAHHRR